MIGDFRPGGRIPGANTRGFATFVSLMYIKSKVDVLCSTFVVLA